MHQTNIPTIRHKPTTSFDPGKNIQAFRQDTHHVQVAPDKGHALVGAPRVLHDEVAAPRGELDALHLVGLMMGGGM